MSHGYNEQKVIWCDICDEFYAESRIDVVKHIRNDHTAKERLENQLKRGCPPEDTSA